MSIGNSPEVLSQQILLGIILVEIGCTRARTGTPEWMREELSYMYVVRIPGSSDSRASSCPRYVRFARGRIGLGRTFNFAGSDFVNWA